MTFSQWWQTLTPAEQKVLNKTSAQFVWAEACKVCAKLVMPLDPSLAKEMKENTK